jgi:hypothetical protein
MPEAFTPERFIEEAPWQAARRPFRGEAHEYVIRGRGELDPEWHDRMIEFIEENGEPGEFGGTRYVYVRRDGYTLWVSRGIYQPHPIINRRRNGGAGRSAR